MTLFSRIVGDIAELAYLTQSRSAVLDRLHGDLFVSTVAKADPTVDSQSTDRPTAGDTGWFGRLTA